MSLFHTCLTQLLGVVVLFLFLPSCAVATVVQGIVVKGLQRTQVTTVLRELPFQQGDHWKVVYEALGERRLRNLGIFSEAYVEKPDASGVVVVRVKERWSLWLLPQASRSDLGSSSASMVLDEYNLWGLDHDVRLAYRRETGKNFSALKGSAVQFSYYWRRLNDSKLSVRLSASSGGLFTYATSQSGMQAAEYFQQGVSEAAVFDYALGDVPGEGWSVDAGFQASKHRYRLLSGFPKQALVDVRDHVVDAGISYRMVDDHTIWMTGRVMSVHLLWGGHLLGGSYGHTAYTFSFQEYQLLFGQNTLNTRINMGLMTGGTRNLFDIGGRSAVRGYYPGELQTRHYVYGTVEGRFPVEHGSNFQLAAFSDLAWIGNGVQVAPSGVAVGVGAGVRWTLRWLVNGTIRGDVAYGVATKRWRFYLGAGQPF